MDTELREEIDAEIRNLERLAREMDSLLTTAGGKRTFVEVRAAGSILHDFYSGVEKIFRRIAVSVDRSLPEGDNWHTDLLLQMTRPVERVRGRVLSDEMTTQLKEYLRFRHLFRNLYGFDLKWDRLVPLCEALSTVLSQLKLELHKAMEG